jgi:quinolinate synthase
MQLVKEYAHLKEEDLLGRIHRAKEELGDSLIILGHHYQRNEVIQFADFCGDSLDLARRAAEQKKARHIVVCRVRFMAETAAVVCGEEQVVLTPNLKAGCPLADFAQLDDVKQAWEELQEADVGSLVPVAYVNSAVVIKAFCAQNGGISCTSANAKVIVGWGLKQGKVFFMPDENLGINAARECGLSQDKVVLWEPGKTFGGNEIEELRRAEMIVWRGHCYVHSSFAFADVERVRVKDPKAKVIVHPECPPAVVEAADGSASTSQILRIVEEAPPGTSFAVGTEVNVVERLNSEYPDKEVFPLKRSVCEDMAKIDPPGLLHILESLVAGTPVNVVHLSPEVRKWGALPISRMLYVKARR